MDNHTFKIKVVNVQKVIEVHGSRIKSLDSISLIIMVKRIHEISFVAATRGAQFAGRLKLITVLFHLAS